MSVIVVTLVTRVGPLESCRRGARDLDSESMPKYGLASSRTGTSAFRARSPAIADGCIFRCPAAVAQGSSGTSSSWSADHAPLGVAALGLRESDRVHMRASSRVDQDLAAGVGFVCQPRISWLPVHRSQTLAKGHTHRRPRRAHMQLPKSVGVRGWLAFRYNAERAAVDLPQRAARPAPFISRRSSCHRSLRSHDCGEREAVSCRRPRKGASSTGSGPPSLGTRGRHG
jgi:hypothetical protein